MKIKIFVNICFTILFLIIPISKVITGNEPINKKNIKNNARSLTEQINVKKAPKVPKRDFSPISQIFNNDEKKSKVEDITKANANDYSKLANEKDLLADEINFEQSRPMPDIVLNEAPSLNDDKQIEDSILYTKLKAPPATLISPTQPITSLSNYITTEKEEDLLAEINEEDFEEPLEEAEIEWAKTKPTAVKEEPNIIIQEAKKKKEGIVYLGEYLEPWKGRSEDELITMQFDNADLIFILDYLKQTFDVTFILDDDIKPPAPDSKLVTGNTIKFKSHAPLTKKEVWNLGLTFLEMAGLAVIPQPEPRTYRVMLNYSDDPKKRSANREALPTFIGVDPSLIPNNDSKIRFVYFVENSDPDTLKEIINQMRSTSSAMPIVLAPMKAIIMTDRAANIKSIMNIIIEIDKSLPETLSIIRLKHADAEKVAQLYQSLITSGQEPQGGYMFRPTRKAETTSYFTKSTRVIPEPRTNSLIVLGTNEGIKKFEDFIFKNIDRDVDLPFSPLHIHELKYLRARETADILKRVINFQPNEPAARFGGVRSGEKYFKLGINITPEETGNRLIINSPYEDYLKIREVIEKMDVEQPQVAIRVLVLNVNLDDVRALGSQIRNAACNPAPTAACPNPSNGCCGLDSILGPNINFQTSTNDFSGRGIIENATGNGSTRLLGDLITLASGNPAGTTLVTLGKDLFGIFGILKVLQTFTRTSVLANPFIIATHKYRAEVSIGETRRLPTAIVTGATGNIDSRGDISANLSVTLIPQISYNDQMVTLDIKVVQEQFTDLAGNRTERAVVTNVILANKEVLALGGLTRDSISESLSKVPILGDIPILGPLFFQYKTKAVRKDIILILITPEIIKPLSQIEANSVTNSKINEAKKALIDMRTPAQRRDPIHRWFFKETRDPANNLINKFVGNQQRYFDETLADKKAQNIENGFGIKNNPKENTDNNKNKSLLNMVPSAKEKIKE